MIRTEFDDDACRSLFFQSPNQLWDLAHYLDLGRRAMRALIDPNTGDKDRYRYALLDQHWADAVTMGPVDGLAGLVGLHLTDSSGAAITPYLRGDVYTIAWWAGAMVSAGKEILAMQQFLAGSDPAKLAGSTEFARRRDQLQKKMAGTDRRQPDAVRRTVGTGYAFLGGGIGRGVRQGGGERAVVAEALRWWQECGDLRSLTVAAQIGVVD